MKDGAALTRGAFLRGSAVTLVAGLLDRGLAAQVQAPTATTRDLVIAQGTDVASFDPHFSTDLGALFSIYDTLVVRRRDNRLHPSLATRWTLLEPTRWEFELRSSVRFHNGDPFTAEDVKFSIERTYDPKARTRVASVFAGVERVEAPDPGRVHFHMRRPDALLPARLAFYGGQILPKRYVEQVGAEGLNARPVGTGPVRFVERVMGDRLVLEAAPYHWGERVDPARVVFKPVPDMATRVAALLRGEVDLCTELTPDHVARIEQHPATRVEEVLLAGLFVLAVNSRRPPLDNPLIKQALSLAVDRDAIVKALWHGRGLVPNGPIPRGDAFHDDTLPPLAHDPDLARRRLAEGGYRGEAVVLESTAGYLANDKPMGEAIVAMWRDVGVNARLEIVEYSVIAQKARERSFKGLRWAGPISTLGDPDGMMWRLLGPGGALDTWRHPRFDELGRAAQVSLDQEFRRRAYLEMSAILFEHVPWIPVLQPMSLYGVRRELDWHGYPNGQIEIRRFNLRLRRSGSAESPR
jgi:peptide/nickel transport system substrate-binding protein